MPDVLGRDRERFAGKTVAVLGSGHSAIGTLTDLAKLADQAPGTRPIWLLRGSDPAKAFGGGANDKLVARGELGAAFAALVTSGRIKLESGFRVSHLIADGPRLAGRPLRLLGPSGHRRRTHRRDRLPAGPRVRRELRIRLDPAIECPVALAPLIDPNEHSCGTVRPHGARELAQDEPGFYFAGMKAYGRAPTFLMLTGYEQVRSIAADIAGDRRPRSGSNWCCPKPAFAAGSLASDASNCCGGPALSDVDACCVADEKAKQQGKAGCGCAS